jgi:hypothetical protein
MMGRGGQGQDMGHCKKGRSVNKFFNEAGLRSEKTHLQRH